MSISLVSIMLWPGVLLASAPSNETEKVVVANISDEIVKSKSIPTGYKGAEGRVKVEKGALKTTALIEGTDAGFSVEFRPVEVNDAKYLTLNIQGDIFQQEGWDHYVSIRIKDVDGNRYPLWEFCQKGKCGYCAGKTITSPDDVRKGTSLKIELPKGLKTVQRFEVVFVGDTSVKAGLTISDIKLVK